MDGQGTKIAAGMYILCLYIWMRMIHIFFTLIYYPYSVDGNIFVGFWKEGKMSGYGKVTYYSELYPLKTLNNTNTSNNNANANNSSTTINNNTITANTTITNVLALMNLGGDASHEYYEGNWQDGTLRMLLC